MAGFLLDHNVARDVASGLIQAGHNVRTGRDLGMERAGDELYLSVAARSDWILISHNAKDFALLHAAWRQWTSDWGVIIAHAGILILIPPVTPATAAQEITAMVASVGSLRGRLYTWRRLRGWSSQP